MPDASPEAPPAKQLEPSSPPAGARPKPTQPAPTPAQLQALRVFLGLVNHK